MSEDFSILPVLDYVVLTDMEKPEGAIKMVASSLGSLEGYRVFYRFPDGRYDELLHASGYFAGINPLPSPFQAFCVFRAIVTDRSDLS